MVCLLQPSGRHFIIDVTVSNPAALTYRAQAIRSHEVVQATNSRRDLDKTARYHGLSSPDITLVAPRRYFTFNVEATGRLSASFRLPVCRRVVSCQWKALGTGKSDWPVSSNVPCQGYWRSGGQVQCSGGAVQ